MYSLQVSSKRQGCLEKEECIDSACKCSLLSSCHVILHSEQRNVADAYILLDLNILYVWLCYLRLRANSMTSHFMHKYKVWLRSVRPRTEALLCCAAVSGRLTDLPASRVEWEEYLHRVPRPSVWERRRKKQVALYVLGLALLSGQGQDGHGVFPKLWATWFMLFTVTVISEVMSAVHWKGIRLGKR